MTQLTTKSRSARRRTHRDDDDPDPHGFHREFKDLIRGVAAGSIVGMPLLYTMEMWFRGMSVSETHLLALLGATLVINFFFALFAGFREEYPSVLESVNESITAVAIGIVYSFLILMVIDEITLNMAPTGILGRVLIETAPVSLGIVFANLQVRKRAFRRASQEKDPLAEQAPAPKGSDPESHQLRQDIADLAATAGGALVFAYNVAPTEEVILIASRMSHLQLLGLMAVSMGLCYLILFAAGFQERRVFVPSLAQSPAAETLMAYAVALAVALGLLLAVGVPDGIAHSDIAVACTIALALPAVVGGAAGRLIL
jgi:putative integral membrane protein (TIGR02587 family)